jgi:hypothetical protein
MKPEEIPCIVLIFKCSDGRWMNKTVPHLQSHQPGEFNFLICLDGCWMQQHYFPFFIDSSVLAKFYSISIGCRPLFPPYILKNGAGF